MIAITRRLIVPGAVAFLLLGLAACGTSDLPPSPSPSPTLRPEGRFAYITNASSGDVSEYAVATDGTLTLLGFAKLPGGAVPNALAADPRGRFLFVARAGGRGGIQAYSIDRTSGLLGDAPGSPFDLDHQADFLTPEPRGRLLWATRAFNDVIDVFSIDQATGGLARAEGLAVAPLGFPKEPALRPDGRFLYVPTFGPVAVLTYATDDATGRLTATGVPVQAPDVVSSIVVDPAGAFLYLTTATPFSSDTTFIYRIDAGTGALARVSGSAFAPGFDFATANLRPDRITFHPSGRFAYVADRPGRTGANSSGFWAFAVQSSGLLGPSAVGPFSTPANPPFLIGDPLALALDPAGRFAYVTDATSNTVAAFAIDARNGALAALGAPVATGQAPMALVIVP